MRVLRAIGKFIWRFMVIFSFIVNLILVIVLLAVVLLIFDIKNNIAQPLVTGLHSSFVGLDQATIDWTIPVSAVVPVNLDIPLETNTVVELTEGVPITITGAVIRAPALALDNATVSITLPAGTRLPVRLDLDVAVRDTLPVQLDVRAVIPLRETQLHDPFANLQLMFEPLAVGLTNLPSGFDEVGPFASDLFAGRLNLLQPNDYSRSPWPGFSRTAGLGYEPNLLAAPVPTANQPLETGLVPIGGIPALDEQLRPEVYQEGGPVAVNQAAYQAMEQAGIQLYYFNGQFYIYRREAVSGAPTGDPTPSETPPVVVTPPTNNADPGILPTPTP
ncbi:MAG: hypothetical protein MUF87_08800 [Anaerolineae bacterium]|jgi:hypothetical protein|nr:hypothetical protein [Anaerolineae bacterium]